MAEVGNSRPQETAASKLSERQYICKNCKNPIYLKADLENLRRPDLSSILSEELDSNGPYYNDFNLHDETLTRSDYKKSLFPNSNDSSAVSSSMDHRLQVNAELFNILSGRTKADHPMCQECADILINTQTKLLEFQENEIKCLETYLAQLRARKSSSDEVFYASNPALPSSNTSSFAHDNSANNSDTADYVEGGTETNNEAVTTPNTSSLHPVFRCSTEEDVLEEEDVSQAALELASLQRELASLQEEAGLLEQQIKAENTELKERQEQLNRASNEYNEQRLLLLESEESLSVLEARFQDAGFQFERMRRTNVLNATFPIWYNGHIGIINGLHLGRLPTKPINWAEINAAWGQCAMLVQCLAKKHQYTFRQYSIIVMGNQSQITLLSNDKKYPLYNNVGGIRIFSPNKFDTAMVMFLDCVAQLQALVERPPEFYLPFKVLDKGRILDTNGNAYSIKYSNSTDEHWTETLKMLLIDLKFIIAASSTVSSSRRTPQPPQMSTPRIPPIN